jgi:hypothetical protein
MSTAFKTSKGEVAPEPKRLAPKSKNIKQTITSTEDLSNALKVPELLPLAPIFEAQAIAPSPSQTFYHVSVFPMDPHLSMLDLSGLSKPEPKNAGQKRPREPIQDDTEQDPYQEILLNRLKMRRGCVVLRDWPRKRQAQAWTRSSIPGNNSLNTRMSSKEKWRSNSRKYLVKKSI